MGKFKKGDTILCSSADDAIEVSKELSNLNIIHDFEYALSLKIQIVILKDEPTETENNISEICDNYCKYPALWDDKLGDLAESHICKKCPLTRLNKIERLKNE